MGLFNVILAPMGEGITDAKIIRFLVKEGDEVAEDTPLVEIATDKVDSEIVAPVNGKVIRFNCNEGDVMNIGSTLLLIESLSVPDDIDSDLSSSGISTFAKTETVNEQTDTDLGESPALSPLVRTIIRENSLSRAEISSIAGSGFNNRITKEDVIAYLNNKKTAAEKISSIPSPQEQKPDDIKEAVTEVSRFVPSGSELHTDISLTGNDIEIVEMDRMRKLIAQHMVNSVRTSPHVTSFKETDVTTLVIWREKFKEEFFNKHGFKLTYLPVFVESAVLTLKEYPQVNVSVDGENIIYKKNINIGIATSLPNGNLIVPVIKFADQKNLTGLANSMNSLTTRARTNKLNPDEIKGGTFTITNLGSFGTLTGTPLINQPEAAILAIGQILKKPSVIETPGGDAIAIRHKVILSLTYDHRIIDGALAGLFLNKIDYLLNTFDVTRKF